MTSSSFSFAKWIGLLDEALNRRDVRWVIYGIAVMSVVIGPLRGWFEFWFCVALLVGVSRIGIVRSFFADMSGFQRCVASGLVVVLMVGQLKDESRKIFPFVSWTMYSKQTGKATKVYAFRAICEDGACVQLSTNLFPSNTLNVARKLKSLVDARVKASGKKREKIDEQIRLLEESLRRECVARVGAAHGVVLMEGLLDMKEPSRFVSWSPCYEIRFDR
ncbi:MAG: hypothetical protein QM627_02715 [Luteolibacter sp.]